LDEIAEEAGYTTGVVYSNFKGKDDLFLAVLDAEAQRRFPPHTELMQHAGSIEEGLRASAREMAEYAHEHPGWTGVYVEFWTHASRRPELRRRVAEQHERLLDTVGALVEEWAGRWGFELRCRHNGEAPMTSTPTSTTPTPNPASPTPPTRADRLRALAGEQVARDRWSRDRLLDFQSERLRL
jgi:AcrR family transcriptional regulator